MIQIYTKLNAIAAKLQKVVVSVRAVSLNRSGIHVSLVTPYPYFITTLVSYIIPNTWSAWEAFSPLRAALVSTQKIMGLSVVCGRAPSILFSTTGREEGEKVKVVTQPCVRI